jgi:hypothetical protein
MTKRVLVIDVGTHKAEELWLFEGRPNFTARNLYRVWRRHGVEAPAETKRQAQRFARKYACRYVLIEPIAHRKLLDFIEAVPTAIFLKGVVSCDASGPTTLLLANASLGHSIIPTKPGLSGETVGTYNIHFPALYELLVDTFIASGDCDRIIVRMNAEGVEGPIIDFLAGCASRKPDLLAGSLGDIKKCFGHDAYEKAKATLADARIPFVYFTSNPITWETALHQISELL